MQSHQERRLPPWALPGDRVLHRALRRLCLSPNYGGLILMGGWEPAVACKEAGAGQGPAPAQTARVERPPYGTGTVGGGGILLSWTRRFCARPSTVLLEKTGRSKP